MMHMITLFFLLVSIPVFAFLKMIRSFQHAKLGGEPYQEVKPGEYLFFILVLGVILLGLFLNSFGLEAGEPLRIYSMTHKVLESHAPLSNDYIVSVVLLLTLGFIAYWYMRTQIERISPLMYLVCSVLLLLNILFAGLYITHTGFSYGGEALDVFVSILFMQIGYLSLSFLYIGELRRSLRFFILSQEEAARSYQRFFRWLYNISRQFQRMPVLWSIFLFPVLFLIQLILILFGQRPDSMIRVFLDTSSFNYSQIPEPEPEVVPGDGHYLCTVTVKGHKKLVKPLRAGIRHGERMTVNRQLLIANAFEHLLETYIPKTHQMVRKLYDTYGYPISKHIKSNWAANVVYVLMKPLEWFFLLVLYTIDAKPENRIHMQYSELRK